MSQMSIEHWYQITSSFNEIAKAVESGGLLFASIASATVAVALQLSQYQSPIGRFREIDMVAKPTPRLRSSHADARSGILPMQGTRLSIRMCAKAAIYVASKAL